MIGNEVMLSYLLKDFLDWVVKTYGKDWDNKTLPENVLKAAIAVGNLDVLSIISRSNSGHEADGDEDDKRLPTKAEFEELEKGKKL